LSHIDRSAFTDNSESDIAFLIENLKNMIMKKLSVSCIAKSLIFSLISSATSFSTASLSVSFSATSQSSTLVSVSDSLTSAISVLMILTSATPGFTVSAFVISSPCFKKMLCRLNKLYLSFLVASASEIILIEDNNTAETTLSHSQASSIAFSLFSVRKIMHISDHKYSVL
ncbi:hypothetical protein BDDG_13439, partial [Blastomyces dermatitidis ATCC 18188]